MVFLLPTLITWLTDTIFPNRLITRLTDPIYLSFIPSFLPILNPNFLSSWGFDDTIYLRHDYDKRQPGKGCIWQAFI